MDRRRSLKVTRVALAHEKAGLETEGFAFFCRHLSGGMGAWHAAGRSCRSAASLQRKAAGGERGQRCPGTDRALRQTEGKQSFN
jgi:hypothetical protein